MPLFPTYDPQNLSDILGKQAQQATAQTQDTGNQARKRLVSQQAASGRLLSGVSDYNLGDFDTQQAQSLSGIQSGLASSLAGVPQEDWLNQQNFQRNLDLTNYIGQLMRPSTLDEVLAGIGTAGRIGGTVAAFGGF